MPAHPYDVLGIGSKHDWHIARTAEHLSFVPSE